MKMPFASGRGESNQRVQELAKISLMKMQIKKQLIELIKLNRTCEVEKSSFQESISKLQVIKR